MKKKKTELSAKLQSSKNIVQDAAYESQIPDIAAEDHAALPDCPIFCSLK